MPALTNRRYLVTGRKKVLCIVFAVLTKLPMAQKVMLTRSHALRHPSLICGLYPLPESEKLIKPIDVIRIILKLSSRQSPGGQHK